MTAEDSREGQQCPDCGRKMERKKGKGVTRCSGELRRSRTIKDFCECGVRIPINKEIGDPL